MNQEDLKLQKALEALLVRSYVDTQAANVEAINGTVYLDGRFDIKGLEEKDRVERNFETRRVLLQVEHEIRRMPDIKGIVFNFSNWSRSGANWSPRSS